MTEKITLSPPQPVTHVIFDLDGLLLDTEDKKLDSMQVVAKKYGGESLPDHIKRQVICTPADFYSDLIVRELGLDVPLDVFKKEVAEEMDRQFVTSTYMPGVERLLKHLHKHNIPMAVASGSPRTCFDRRVDHLGPTFKSYFHHFVLAGDDPDVKANKPAPDTFVICGRRFDGSPDGKDCLVFEDSLPGVTAACRAGMHVVWVPHPLINTEEELKKNRAIKPTQVIRSIEVFQPEDFGLPAFTTSNSLN